MSFAAVHIWILIQYFFFLCLSFFRLAENNMQADYSLGLDMVWKYVLLQSDPSISSHLQTGPNRIALYSALPMLPVMTRSPVPPDWEHCYKIVLLLPCLTMWRQFWCLIALTLYITHRNSGLVTLTTVQLQPSTPSTRLHISLNQKIKDDQKL